MAWSLLLLPFLIAQGAPAPAPADKPAASAEAPVMKPASDKAPAPSDAPAAGEAEVKPAAKPAPAKAAPPAPTDGFSSLIFTFAPIIAIMYFLLLRPQKNQEAKHKQLLSNLKKNDKVLTSGGICGTVTSADPASDRVVVRVDDDKGVKLTFTKASIVRVIEPTTEKAADSSS